MFLRVDKFKFQVPVHKSTCPQVDPEGRVPFLHWDPDASVGKGRGPARCHVLEVGHDSDHPVPPLSHLGQVTPDCALPVAVWVQVGGVLPPQPIVGNLEWLTGVRAPQAELAQSAIKIYLF